MIRICGLLLVALACCRVTIAAEPVRSRKPLDRPISLGELTPTPEMWFYEQQMKEYRDPKAAVRRKAEFKAEQRLKRLAAMQWYGLDNSRPTTSTDWNFGPPSPQWGSSSSHPSLWRGGRSATTVYEIYSPGYNGYR